VAALTRNLTTTGKLEASPATGKDPSTGGKERSREGGGSEGSGVGEGGGRLPLTALGSLPGMKKTFVPKFMNVVDPMLETNNLTRSVSKGMGGRFQPEGPIRLVECESASVQSLLTWLECYRIRTTCRTGNWLSRLVVCCTGLGTAALNYVLYVDELLCARGPS